ncbi:carbohydrate ABC transporter permease [Clostridium sp. 19966]|uniref:carbohydrate ABC transporter permease n=1 Tax=Clostridium sp. 19966 TaxID=2768166 RepID=UPI0028DE810A|nr:carbohydrate ABC transporter permease [Clostridium sp. 19966]MDT8716887.1 carbohydrate ABC transporter permease [Clostridium sp. 19966]
MKTKTSSAILFVIALILLLIVLSPLALVVLGAFKSYSEIMTNAISLPKSLSFQNFINVFKDMNYPKAFVNTAIVTFLGTLGIIIVGSLAGYKLSRTKTKTSYVLFMFCIFPMMIPFQSYMITLVKVSKTLHLMNSIWGLSVIYWGLGCPLAIFLYHGFMKGISTELDECASLDGCTQIQAFIKIIFPLLKPTTATVIVINAMWIWNDFLLPLLIIGSNKTNNTLQLAAYGFMGQYKMQWNNIMSGAILIIIPALIIYLIFQKNIIAGMVDGSVKG